MNREQAKDAAKERMEEYLRSKGINIGATGKRKFLCLNPNHNDSKPSMQFYRDSNKVFCFSCKASYDVFDLIAMDYNLEAKEAFDKAYELFGIHVDGTPERERKEMTGQKQDKNGQYTHTHTHVYTHNETELDFTKVAEAAHAALMSNAQALAHYTARGLTEDFIKQEGLGYAEGGYNSLLMEYPEHQSKSYKAALYKYVLPFRDESGAVRYFQTEIADRTKVDEYNGKYRKISGCPAPLYVEHLLRQKKPGVIFLVEGLYDAYSIKQAGGNAIALQGAGGDTRFIKLYQQYKPEAVIVFYMDADRSGAAYEKKILEELPELKERSISRRPSSGKDANEELVKDADAFYQAVAQMKEEAQALLVEAEEDEKKAYLSTTAGASLQQFINGIAESVNTPCLSTGFEILDSVIDGGLYEGLITIGAISSLGKTSLILQIADQIAEAGHDVLMFSLEMARAELMSKSISRHTLRLALDRKLDTRSAKTARGITDGKRHASYSKAETQLIQDAISEYSRYADRLYIQEGIGDIGVYQMRETIEKHIRFTGRRPLVIVDYLQILAPYNEKATDKQNTDKAVLELKRISRDFKIPVIAISSFNRDNYKAAVNMASFKESGAVEYSSDVLIGLQLKGAGDKDFDELKAKSGYRVREIELVILKNRQGKVGDKILYEYYPMFNYFKEKGVS